METLTSGTLAGTGSFHCDQCGYVVTLAASDELPRCPGCSGSSFTRASLFGPRRFRREIAPEPLPVDRDLAVTAAHDAISEPGEYLIYEDGGEPRVVALEREWTRIGRSLAADLRFDDPTVSRRHALLVRQPDGVRILDDRSLNGVFVNGARVEWRTLTDGDEIVVGRYRLRFVTLTSETLGAATQQVDVAAE